MSKLTEQIKAEIERLKKHSESAKKEWIDEGYNQNAFAEDCRIKSFDKLLAFIDSLEDVEPDEGLKKAADVNSKNYGEDAGGDTQERLAAEYDFYQGFIIGADWQRGRMMENAVESEVTITSGGILLRDLRIEDFDYKDRTKIIILKEN